MTKPILLDLPEQIESERLIIRPPKPGDGLAMNAAIRESLEELRPWMDWAQTAPDVDTTEKNLRKAAARWLRRTDLMLTLWRKMDGLFVGAGGLHRINWSVPSMEIGYWLRTGLTRQGYMTEAVNAITAFAFETLGAERIEIRCDARNTRSYAVAERAGYTLEARLKKHARAPDGSLRDTLIYVKFRGEG